MRDGYNGGVWAPLVYTIVSGHLPATHQNKYKNPFADRKIKEYSSLYFYSEKSSNNNTYIKWNRNSELPDILLKERKSETKSKMKSKKRNTSWNTLTEAATKLKKYKVKKGEYHSPRGRSLSICFPSSCPHFSKWRDWERQDYRRESLLWQLFVWRKWCEERRKERNSEMTVVKVFGLRLFLG